jgi:hypothetical protein
VAGSSGKPRRIAVMMESRFQVLESEIRALKAELAAVRREASATETALLFFMSLTDKTGVGPARGTVLFMEEMAQDLGRKKDSQNAQELARLARILGQMVGIRSL